MEGPSALSSLPWIAAPFLSCTLCCSCLPSPASCSDELPSESELELSREESDTLAGDEFGWCIDAEGAPYRCRSCSWTGGSMKALCGRAGGRAVEKMDVDACCRWELLPVAKGEQGSACAQEC